MKTGIVQKFLALPFSARQSALAKKRTAISHSDFVSLITRSGGDAGAADLIHSKLQDWIYHNSFTPHPDDSLSAVFGIAEEELDEDIIMDVLATLGLSAPPQQEVTAFGPIDTATRVAQFVALARTANNSRGLR